MVPIPVDITFPIVPNIPPTAAVFPTDFQSIFLALSFKFIALFFQSCFPISTMLAIPAFFNPLNKAVVINAGPAAPNAAATTPKVATAAPTDILGLFLANWVIRCSKPCFCSPPLAAACCPPPPACWPPPPPACCPPPPPAC